MNLIYQTNGYWRAAQTFGAKTGQSAGHGFNGEKIFHPNSPVARVNDVNARSASVTAMSASALSASDQ